MLVSERERVRYDYDRDYDRSARADHYARYDYNESGYEAERNRTSSSYRDSLMSSLERPATRSRLERSDADRYGFYRTNIEARENNYDRFWDRQQERASEKKPASKKKVAFVAAYMLIALVAIVAVTMSVVGVGEKTTLQKKTVAVETLSASAELAESADLALSAATEESVEEALVGGENYILLKSGEAVAVTVPEQVKPTKEKEKWFDRFCNWLNGVFGG